MPHTLQTFELYIDRGTGETTFEPLLCSGPQEAISLVRQLIETRGLAAVEVRLLGRTLFTLRG
jgi:hypothetical protein